MPLRCKGDCLTDEHGTCVVLAARRYLKNHRAYLNYPPILERDLPVERRSRVWHSPSDQDDEAGLLVAGSLIIGAPMETRAPRAEQAVPR